MLVSPPPALFCPLIDMSAVTAGQVELHTCKSFDAMQTKALPAHVVVLAPSHLQADTSLVDPSIAGRNSLETDPVNGGK